MVNDSNPTSRSSSRATSSRWSNFLWLRSWVGRRLGSRISAVTPVTLVRSGASRGDQRFNHVADSVEAGADCLPCGVPEVDAFEDHRELEERQREVERDVADVA